MARCLIFDIKKINKYFKYCFVGGIGSILDFCLFSIFIIFFNLNYLISNVFSFSIGTIVVCYLQKNWTFKYENKDDPTLYLRYLLSIGVTYLFNTAILIILIQYINLNTIFSKLIQIVLSAFLGYIIQNSFVFKQKCSR
jgi:putative flippase GtrA